jgi:pimeloyl-ACP methyl ester carboxylesterase
MGGARGAAWWRPWLIALLVLALVVAPLTVNALLVDAKVRAAMARTGGTIMDTGVMPANVKVEGDGPPILLIHGFGAAMDWWDGIARALAADHRVVRVDLIGHGGTEAPPSGYAIERQAKLAAAVLDKLGVERVTVIGHSMGGGVATALAEANPGRVERLVLIDTPAKVETTFGLGTRFALTPVLGELLSRFISDARIREMLAQGFAPGFAVPDKFVADVKQLTYTAFHSAHDDSVAYRTDKPLFERLGGLEKVPPLLVIFGSRDALVPPASAKDYETLPGVKLVIIEGAGHSPMVEAPEKTLELIKNFLTPRP